MQGSHCQVPAGCNGTLDSQGACCTAELSADGTCCEVINSSMQCCPSGEVDASRTCDGLATGIDLQGLPCNVSAALMLKVLLPK